MPLSLWNVQTWIQNTIRKVMHTLESCFDIISVREASDYYAKKATVCGW